MSRPQKKYHYIYKTTCKITGKFYIGMHSTDNLDDGYLGSGKILGYSRKKYGDENHIREIIEMLPSREILKTREKDIVNEELLTDPLNINLKYGGDGGWDHVLNSSKRQEIQKRRSSAGGKVGGKVTGKINGVNALAKARIDGKNSFDNFTGKKHTEETKRKMSATKKLLGFQCGKNNSQFGVKRIWIRKDGVANKRVLQEELQMWLNSGWLLGIKEKISKPKIVKPKISKRRWSTLQCVQCGTIFEASQRDVRRNRKFCGLACSSKSQSTKHNSKP